MAGKGAPKTGGRKSGEASRAYWSMENAKPLPLKNCTTSAGAVT